VHKKQTRLSFLASIFIWSLPFVVSGCMSPKALEHVVVAYDYSATQSLVEQLLINIARSHHHQPIHFTAISNIAATFDYRFTAGATPPLGGLDGGFSLAPIFGGTVAENPTFSINPIEGTNLWGHRCRKSHVQHKPH
jgi:hypothetical protein